MTTWIRILGTVLLSIGFDPRKLIAALRGVPHYFTDLFRYIWSRDDMEKRLFRLRLVPTLSDLYSQSGVARGHYFHQDLWAAREVYKRNPLRHIDVGSRIDGFVAHLLCFRDVDVIDIRSLKSNVRGLAFLQADLMKNLTAGDLEADSVSCLHALEHFGLGRYGDPLLIDGWRLGLKNLANLVKPSGVLLLSVPVGQPCVEFNAHRIFAPSTITHEAKQLGLSLLSFHFIDDSGNFHEGKKPEDASHLTFGCGCFLFERSTITL